MDDEQIRVSFYHKWIGRHFGGSDSVVINEFGLNHGQNRADIIIVNGRLTGYEIKSDCDSLRRLRQQITSYNSIFDRVYMITTSRHLEAIQRVLPEWWGIILANEGKRGAIHFKSLRKAKANLSVDDSTIVRLLWRNEAQEVLRLLGLKGSKIRERRERLYSYIVLRMDSHELRRTVRNYLMNRKDWRCPTQLFRDGG